MCGIAGIFCKPGSIQQLGPSPLELLKALRHRGPDDEGVWQSERGDAALVHARLAILELSDAGHQPMGRDGGPRSNSESAATQSRLQVVPSIRDSTGGATTARQVKDPDELPADSTARERVSAAQDGYWLVFNGEIYNFRELRAELEAAGERFTGNSDTEVLLRLLVKKGADAVERLAGMFAFAFYDSHTGRAILVRDAFGVKPLYYLQRDSLLAFASEAKALNGSMSGLDIDASSVRDTLMWGTVPEPGTIAAEIRQLPAGCLLEWDGSTARIERWHRVHFGDRSPPRNAVSATRRALLESMERHLVSDVPVGIFLSGGIDSTAVLALARHVLGPDADLRTFSIGFEDPAFDESLVARRTAEHFGARYTEWRMTAAQGREEIASYLTAMDQPTIDGFNTWCVSRLARREGMKVVLSGLGGDELFAGYDSFQQVPRFLQLYKALGPFRPWIARLLYQTAPGSRWRRLGAFLRGSGTPLEAFHVQRGIFTEAEARTLTETFVGVDPGPSQWTVQDLPQQLSDTVSFLEVTRYMCNQLLRDSDIFSMAHGLELRVPFVDVRLFGALSAIPAQTRLRRGKRLLIEAVPELPEWVLNQPKRGFRFPFQAWLERDFSELMAKANEQSPVELGAWYRQWTVAAVLEVLRRLNEPGRCASST